MPKRTIEDVLVALRERGFDPVVFEVGKDIATGVGYFLIRVYRGMNGKNLRMPWPALAKPWLVWSEELEAFLDQAWRELV